LKALVQCGLFPLIRLLLSSHTAVIAENRFLRKHLALFQERRVKPRCSTAATRALMVLLSRFFEWHDALVMVKPETCLKWHRTAFRAFWRWKSRKRGRPRLPKNLRELIRRMACDNPTWGEERIADELKLKLAFGSHRGPSGNICIENVLVEEIRIRVGHVRSERSGSDRRL
jgi:putative transposase